MANKQLIQRFKKGSLWTIGIVLLIVLTSFVLKKASEQKCTDVKIIIPGINNSVERQDIDQILRNTTGLLIGRKLNDINLYQLEQKLNKNPYISHSKTYAEINGVIHIDIIQKQPVLRIINKYGNDFYIDSEGKKMPISANFTPRVLVANGNINEKLGSKTDTVQNQLTKNLFEVAKFISKNELWTAQIVQLYVNPQQDIIMVPRVGSQDIILGNADSLEKKFDKLLIFYKKAMPKVGWNTYKTINLKFSNQIVCEKNDSLLIKKSLPNIEKLKQTQQTVKDLILNEIKKN